MWTLQPPTLTLGIEAGPPQELELANVTSAVLLSDGSLAIANAGTSQIRYFSATGVFLHSTGRHGQGPGEFSGAPIYLHAQSHNSLLAYDAGNRRLTFLDPDGRPRSARDLARPDTLEIAWFPRLYPNAFLEADEAPGVRPCVDAVVPQIARRPAFSSAILVRVDQLGFLWVTPLPLPAGTSSGWQVYDLAGQLVATTTLPSGFRPFQITARELLGRLEDSLGVEHVVTLPVRRHRTAPLSCTIAIATPPPAEAGVLRTLRNAGRVAIQAQEAYYADHDTYAGRSDALAAPELSVVRLVIVASDKRHWFGLLIDPRTGTTCATGVGYQPPGWEEAVSRCSGSAG